MLLIAQMTGQLRMQAGLQHPLHQLRQKPALPGQLHPAFINPVHQLIQEPLVEELINRLLRRPLRTVSPRHNVHPVPRFLRSVYTDNLIPPSLFGQRRSGNDWAYTIGASTASRHGPSCAWYCAESTAIAAESVAAAVRYPLRSASVTLAIRQPATVDTAASAIRTNTSSTLPVSYNCSAIPANTIASRVGGASACRRFTASSRSAAAINRSAPVASR